MGPGRGPLNVHHYHINDDATSNLRHPTTAPPVDDFNLKFATVTQRLPVSPRPCQFSVTPWQATGLGARRFPERSPPFTKFSLPVSKERQMVSVTKRAARASDGPHAGGCIFYYKKNLPISTKKIQKWMHPIFDIRKKKHKWMH